MITTILTPLLLVAFASAAPGPSRKPSGCDISHAQLPVPSNQTALVAPSTPPSFIALGVGVQNYTCSNTSTYTNVGAVAELLDLSCVYNTPLFADAPSAALALWDAAPPSITAQKLIAFLAATPLSVYPVLGQHYYVPNATPGGAPSPKWDFTSAGAYKGNAEAFVVAAKVATLTAPAGNKTDIDWVSLKGTSGELASQIFRVDTQGGVAPASCTPGSPLISVKYTAQYWLYGGSIKN